ncbi:O-antigen ligase family protein [Aliarcobacter skirrowii]|uniref:O-antigen ligase family protein n=1 Tax=Aliarcobacter skirrowii TaxID=28200 RepID=UPI0029AA5C93|nr:O-antigen ligase family protein [Aliarcobacter skirrowii]MDX4058774.1 O-antigen ligase family protein [Aliarcobacter skirrowii]
MLEKIKSISFDKVSYYSILLFALILPLSKAAISFFIFWFILLIILKKDYKNSFNVLKENKIFLYIGLIILYGFISSLWSEYEEYAFKFLGHYLYWIIVPAIVILVKKEWLYKILNAFLVGMFISEMISYGIYFEILTGFNGGPSNPSPFMSTIHYSIFLAFTSLVLLYRFLFENESLKVKVVLFIFFLITTTNLMISTGRTGQLAFFVTLFIVFIIKYRVSLKSIILSVVFAITISLMAYNSLDLFKKRVDAAISDVQNVVLEKNFESSWGIRAGFWIVTYDAFKEAPILGHGLGDHNFVAQSMIEKYKYPYFSEFVTKFISEAHFHNQYLMFLAEGGVVALFLFLLFCYKLYKLEIDDIELKHISIIGITVFMISFISEPLLYWKFSQIFFLFIVSFIIVSSKKDLKI